MLGKVKSRHGTQTSIRQRSQIADRLSLKNVQRQVFTPLDEDAIAVDSARLESSFAQYFEPFAASTADVEYAGVEVRLLQKRQIDSHLFLDLFRRASQHVLEREIE